MKSRLEREKINRVAIRSEIAVYQNMERLQKVIAQAGVCSRRKAEELIVAGRVTVNGETVTQLGTKVDAERDHVKVDGRRIRTKQERRYLLLNKPGGYICTVSDPEGRPKIMDLIRGTGQRLYPVGRLDYHSEGLILLTNDGEFANRVASAGEHCPKTYLVKVRGNPSPRELQELASGVLLDNRQTAQCRIAAVKPGENPWLQVTLIEGRNNQIRRMFERIGHPVQKLKRIQIGFLRDDNLRPSEYRNLTIEEVRRFKKLGKTSPAVR